MTTLAPGIPGAHVPTPSLPPPGAVNNAVPFKRPLPRTLPIPDPPKRPPAAPRPVMPPPPFSSLQALDPIEFADLMSQLGDGPVTSDEPTNMPVPPFEGGQVRNAYYGLRVVAVHSCLGYESWCPSSVAQFVTYNFGPITSVEAYTGGFQGSQSAAKLCNASGCSGGSHGPIGKDASIVSVDLFRADGTPKAQDIAQGGNPPGIPTPIGNPQSSAPPVTSPPDAPPAIPDTIPETLPPGIPDPNEPSTPEIPDFVPQILPPGIPDPDYPDPEPEEEDDDDPTQPDIPPEPDSPEDDPPTVPTPDPGLPDTPPEDPGQPDTPGIPTPLPRPGDPETPDEDEDLKVPGPLVPAPLPSSNPGPSDPAIPGPELPDQIPDNDPDLDDPKIPDELPGENPNEGDELGGPDFEPDIGDDQNDKDKDKVPIGFPGGGGDPDSDNNQNPTDGTPGGGNNPITNPVNNNSGIGVPGDPTGTGGPDYPEPEDKLPVPPPKCPPGCIPQDGQCDDMKIDICNEPCIQTLLNRTANIQSDVNQIRSSVNEVRENVDEIKDELKTPKSVILPFSECGSDSPRLDVITAKPMELIFTALTAFATDEDNRAKRLCDLDLIDRIYRILGGESWFQNDEQVTPRLQVNPEESIEQQRAQAFQSDEPSNIEVNNLIALLQAIASVDRHRSGHHELPANVPTDLSDENTGTTNLQTQMQWEEWMLRQLDGLMGAWPIKIKYRNADNEETELEFKNLAELQAELIGLVLSVGADTDVLQELGFKAIAESIKAQASAIQAADYARANAEFLGYKSNERGKNLPISITPGAKNIKDALKTSTQKITRIEYSDRADLREYLQQILVGTEVIKAAFYRPYTEGDNLPGDNLRDIREEEKTDQDAVWNDYLNELRNLEGQRFGPLIPRPDINNLTSEENDES